MIVLPGCLAAAAALFAQAPAAPPVAAPAQADTYCARFERGLEALDRDEHAAAARAFLNAGELAYEAPVWRVHAGVALARAGDEGAATALFRAALDAGYPPSDLAALDASGGAAAAAWAAEWSPVRQSALDVARSGWRSVSTRGLVGPEALLADVRHARVRPSGDTQRDRISHIIGTSQGLGSSTFEYFRVDARASTTTHWTDGDAHVQRIDESAAVGAVAGLVFPDAPRPWPRGAPFVRALRTGLLIDIPEVRVEHDTFRLASVHTTDGRRTIIAQTGSRWESPRQSGESIDLGRFTLRPITIERSTSSGSNHLEEVTDLTLRKRARALLGREARLWRRADGGAIGAGALLAACNWQPPTAVRAGSGPLLLLDEGAQQIVHEYDFSAARAAEGLTSGDLYCRTPAIDLEARRLVVSLSVGDGTLEAFDTTDGAFVWRVPARRSMGGKRDVSFSGPQIVVTSRGEGLEPELRRADDGALLADGAALGLVRLRGSEDGSLLVGEGLDALFVFEGQRPLEFADALTRKPRLTLWLLRSKPAPSRAVNVVAVASDGAWQAPAAALSRARVLLDDRFVPAEALAPWLYDPLHVRTALNDTDPSPRRFPWPQ